jgi:biotin operon repressor
MKSMLPKQKSYIPRFSLLINTIECFFGDSDNVAEVTKESILKAEKLSKYFIAMAKKIKIDTVEKYDIKKLLELNKNKTIKEQFAELYKQNKDLNRTEVSELLGVTRNTIQRYIKELEV